MRKRHRLCAKKTVYRNDTESSIGAVSQYDVLYYLEEISTVWAYSNKQTGTIEAVLPSRSNPTSVTIAGKNFTRLARHRRPPLFRPMVHIKWGGYCNAAFGRDNTVAAVISAEEINTTVYGVVAGTGKTEYVTPSGDKYTAKYIDVVASERRDLPLCERLAALPQAHSLPLRQGTAA